MMDAQIAQMVFEDSQIAYALVDQQGRITALGGYVALFGNASACVGCSLLDLVPELIGNEAVLDDIWAGRLSRFQLGWINRETPSGQTIYLSLILLPYRGAAGQVNSLVYLVKEATELSDLTQQLAQSRNELRLTQRELERRLQQLDALHQSALALLTSSDVNTLLDYVLAAVSRALPYTEKGLAAIFAEHTTITRSFPTPFDCMALQAYLDETPATLRQPQLITDLRATSTLCTTCTQQAQCALSSAIRIPLRSPDRLWGVLLFASSRPSAFVGDVDLLESFATMASLALANAYLHTELQHAAITDELTGLYNRRGLFDLGQREVAHARHHGIPLAVILFDIDNLKTINDTLGHAAGDQLLSMVATHCRQTLRERDIFARYGGDEFIVLLPETDGEDARAVAERLRQTITALQVHTGAATFSTTASFGVAVFNRHTRDLDEVLTHADRAHYAAKQAGKNHVHLWR